MLRKGTLIVLGSLVAVLFSTRPFYSQINKGTIELSGTQRVSVAVSLLKNLGLPDDKRRISESIADTLVYDLNLSGWFRVLDRTAYIENPQTSGITAGSFDFKDWSTIGAEGLVKGGFALQGDDLSVEMRLFDVFQAKQIVGKRYGGRGGDSRRIAHKFADEIIAQFTGIPGVFNTRIAYISSTSGFKELFVSHLDGTGKQQLTSNRTINLRPSWSPEGRFILYTSYKEGLPALYLYDLATGRDTRLGTQRNSTMGGRWSPDGKQIVATFEENGNSDLYLLDRSGKTVRRLTEDPGIDVSPTWAPEGNRIAFVSDRSGSPQIYAMDVATGKTQRLSYSGSYNTSPDWAPKGDKITYTGRVAGRFHIFTMNAQGGDAQQLTSSAGDNEDPSFAPDGRMIVFSSSRTGRYQLHIMRDTGENQQRLTASGGGDTNPSWSPRLE
jgi:TolB protein